MKKAARKTSSPRPMDVLDEASDSCRTIHALAELLSLADVELLHPQTVSVTGALIKEEIKKLHKGLAVLHKNQSSRS